MAAQGGRLRLLLLSAVRGLDAVTWLARPLPILTYHAISRIPSPITLHPDTFSAQLRALREAGYVGVSLREALAGGASERTVALTFDDGFADFAHVALPALKYFGFGATVFLVTGWLGRRNDWPSQPLWAPRFPLLTPQDVKRLATDGVEFAAHAVNHLDLTVCSADELTAELAESRQAVEALTGQPCRYFAYPYGALDDRVAGAVRELFDAAVTTELRIANSGDDPWRLPRIDAYYLQPPWLAGRLDDWAGRLALGVRGAMRRLRRGF